MLDQSTSRRIRSVLAALDEAERLPIGELLELSATAVVDVTIDRANDPALILVQPRRSDVFSVLSPRELEVAELVAAGLRNGEIAQRLYISLATVKDHVHRILSKTGLDGRAQVAAAWRGG